MGVTGLLTLLKSIQKPCNLKEFKGQTIGVDAYGWLHRGAVACAMDLALGKPTAKFVDFAMHRVRMLLHFGIRPYIVFDGDRLPSKATTEEGRAERRRKSTEAGLELLRVGKVAMAYQELQKAVDVTPTMARMLIEELKRSRVEYVVAPYEADSQLAYLEAKGFIDAILSEDSDLLVFGAKCLLTKLDQFGECVMVRQMDFSACREVSFGGWTPVEFRRMAILSGCDYLEGIHRMGLKTAHRLVRKYKTIDRIIRGAQLEGRFRIPPGYLEDFRQAEMTFLYQYVFCPEAQQLVNLTAPDYKGQLDGITYIGTYVEPIVAQQIARGDIDPITKQLILVSPIQPFKHMHKTTVSFKHSKSLDSTTNSKSIESFFSTKRRQPLAELDPNSFKRSPSQQRLLQDQANGLSWSADVAPLRVRSAPRRTPGPTNTSKRQRLCAESSEPPSWDGQVERSRYFFGAAEPSPLPKQSGAGKRKKRRETFEMWSDDSIDNAMVELADSQQTGGNTGPSPETSQASSKEIPPTEDTSAPSPNVQKADHKQAENQISRVETSEKNDSDREPPQEGPQSPSETGQSTHALVSEPARLQVDRTPAKPRRTCTDDADRPTPFTAGLVSDMHALRETTTTLMTSSGSQKFQHSERVATTPTKVAASPRGSEDFLVPENEASDGSDESPAGERSVIETTPPPLEGKGESDENGVVKMDLRRFVFA